MTSNLNHPNIINVYDIQRDGEVEFITLELLRGRTLRQEIVDRKSENRLFSLVEAKGILL